jgi:hypothetical protein
MNSLIFYVSEFKFLQYSDVQDQKITTNATKITTNDIHDQKLIIFGNEKKHWRNNNDLLKITADWLFEKGRLRPENLPVYPPRGERYLINSKPVHKSGRPFDGKPYQISQDMWLHTNFSREDCKRHAEYLMQTFAPEVDFKILGFQ